MSRNTTPLGDRVQKAAEILQIEVEKIEQALDCLGIEVGDEFSEKLIDAETTTEAMIQQRLVDFLGHGVTHPSKAQKTARLAAAVAILKDRDPFKKDEPGQVVSLTDPSKSTGNQLVETVVKHLDEARPISQLKDRELLERYVQVRDFEMEQELSRRAKNQPFIVLKENGKHEPGKEPIDVDASMDLLKSARKGRTNPTIVPYGADKDKVANVYRITELNLDDRKVEICPICGETLYKSYCEKCTLNWSSVDKDSRAYAWLVAKESEQFRKDSYADRKALHASAVKGIEDLEKTWPSMSKAYRERKEADDLPKLVLIENRPSRQVADPFHVAGNRQW